MKPRVGTCAQSKMRQWECLDVEGEGGRAMDLAAMVMMFVRFTLVRGDLFFCVVGDLN